MPRTRVFCGAGATIWGCARSSGVRKRSGVSHPEGFGGLKARDVVLRAGSRESGSWSGYGGVGPPSEPRDHLLGGANQRAGEGAEQRGPRGGSAPGPAQRHRAEESEHVEGNATQKNGHDHALRDQDPGSVIFGKRGVEDPVAVVLHGPVDAIFGAPMGGNERQPVSRGEGGRAQWLVAK